MQQPFKRFLSTVCVTFLFSACLQDDATNSQSMLSSSHGDLSSIQHVSSFQPSHKGISSIQYSINNLTSSVIEYSSQIDESSSQLKDFLSSSVIESSSSHNQSVSSSVHMSSSSIDLYAIETGVFTDERDGQEYRWTKINGQTWMGGNLNFATDEGSTCFNDSLHNCEIFGRLYTWGAAMQGEAGSKTIPSGVQGVCPNSWHLPSKGEWKQFMLFIDDIPKSGALLKTTDLWISFPGTNEFKFYANPAGNRHLDGRFAGENYATNWWSTREESNKKSSVIYGLSDQDNSFSWGPTDQDMMYSVRCLKDE